MEVGRLRWVRYGEEGSILARALESVGGNRRGMARTFCCFRVGIVGCSLIFYGNEQSAESLVEDILSFWDEENRVAGRGEWTVIQQE